MNKKDVRKVLKARDKVLRKLYEEGLTTDDLTDEEMIDVIYETVRKMK